MNQLTWSLREDEQMTKHLKKFILLLGVLGMAGCSTDQNDSKIQTEPVSLLRIKDGSDDTIAPRHLLIRPDQNSLSVFYTFDEQYENHELVTYDVSDEKIEIVYDDRGLSLTDIDNRQYEDTDGNIFQLEFYAENYEDD